MEPNRIEAVSNKLVELYGALDIWENDQQLKSDAEEIIKALDLPVKWICVSCGVKYYGNTDCVNRYCDSYGERVEQ